MRVKREDVNEWCTDIGGGDKDHVNTDGTAWLIKIEIMKTEAALANMFIEYCCENVYIYNAEHPWLPLIERLLHLKLLSDKKGENGWLGLGWLSLDSNNIHIEEGGIWVDRQVIGGLEVFWTLNCHSANRSLHTCMFIGKKKMKRDTV